MYDELIKRLREKAGAFDYDGRPDIACDYEQAADAIEELQKRVVENFTLQKQRRTNKMTDNERKEYCKDCKRSIYGEYHDCDTNIENNGRYVMADEKCYCKILPNGQRAEKYSWEQ